MPKSRRRWELTVDAQQSSLGEVADFIEEVGQALNLDPDAAFAVQLATDEACQNAVEHACRYSPHEQVTVACEHVGSDLHIVISERGEPFDPATIAPPRLHRKLSERNGGGLGLHFMRHMMDDIQFDRTADGLNTVRMIKKGIVGQAERQDSRAETAEI